LNRETDRVKALADGQKATVSASLKRETGMLKLATLILKKENEESIAARSAGRIVTRQAGKEARWKTALVSKQPAPDASGATTDEPVEAPAAPVASSEAAAPAPADAPPVPSNS
jgi:hypothetical protein